jgi:hypothetical protein
MLKYDIKQDEFLKSDFINKAEVKNIKTYPEEQVKRLAKAYKGLISKAEMEELSKEDSTQLKIFKAELESLKKVVVVNDDLKKENLYYRSKADISKSEAIEQDFKNSLIEERNNTLRKGFEAGMIDEETLEKATGHKYFKREPKAGGGYKYYYTEAQYKKEKIGASKDLKIDESGKTTRDLNKKPYSQKDVDILTRLISKETDKNTKAKMEQKLAKVKSQLGQSKTEEKKDFDATKYISKEQQKEYEAIEARRAEKKKAFPIDIDKPSKEYLTDFEEKFLESKNSELKKMAEEISEFTDSTFEGKDSNKTEAQKTKEMQEANRLKQKSIMTMERNKSNLKVK